MSVVVKGDVVFIVQFPTDGVDVLVVADESRRVLLDSEPTLEAGADRVQDIKNVCLLVIATEDGLETKKLEVIKILARFLGFGSVFHGR